MIEKEYEEFNLECDECGRYVPRFDTFQDALDYSDEMGWGKKKVNGEWENYCDDCLEFKRRRRSR